MRNFINILVFILILFLVVNFVWTIIPILLVGGVALYVYFKVIKPYINKKRDHKQSNNIYKEEVVMDKEEDTYSGPVIDVDYEDVDKE